MSNSMDRLRYHMYRQDELKKSIRRKLGNIKEIHGKVFALEPKMKESFTRVQSSSVAVADLTSKAKKTEDEIKYALLF